MAYADDSFYTETYYGDALAGLSASDINKWLERASDELDVITFARLTFAFPTVDAHVNKVKKAVCAMAEALFCIDEFRKAAAAQKMDDGSYRGSVASISSGRESVSYSSGSASASSYAVAAASEAESSALMARIAAKYLSGIPDANGINLLYAGVR